MSNEIKIIRVPEISKYESLGYTCFRVDRQSPVGNPYFMKNESERDLVCDRYESYFKDRILYKDDVQFILYLRKIYKAHILGPVALACWCSPRRCHAETIAKFIKSFDK